ncbi:MAG: rhomboid family intramembrane serine protease [Patescibacteria group bacterium]
MQRIQPRPPVVTAFALLFSIIFLAFIFSRTSFAIVQALEQFGFIPEKMLSVGEWYRIVSSLGIHENSMFLAVEVLFLLVLGGPFEKRQGAQHFLVVFMGASLVSFIAFSLFAWGQGLVLTGSFAGIGGVVGAWVAETHGRKRVSHYGNVVVRDFEELPALLVLALWLFVIFVLSILFSADFFIYFSAVCIATFAGGVIHFAFTPKRGKL